MRGEFGPRVRGGRIFVCVKIRFLRNCKRGCVTAHHINIHMGSAAVSCQTIRRDFESNYNKKKQKTIWNLRADIASRQSVI